MKDVAKCAGHGCPVRDGCDRFVMPEVDWQRWVEPDARWGYVSKTFKRLILYRTKPPFDRTEDGEQVVFTCGDHVPAAMQPHGGASEEGDAC